MELYGLDGVDLVVSYTIQFIFVAKSANSPEPPIPCIALYSFQNTLTDNVNEKDFSEEDSVFSIQAWQTGNTLLPLRFKLEWMDSDFYS